MQTFVPLTGDFSETAAVLDRQRLNKQALEGWQILMTLLELDPQGNVRIPKGWVNHPAVKMWRGHEVALYNYIQAMVDEWKSRGYNSTIGDKAKATLIRAYELGIIKSSTGVPSWMLDSDLFRDIASSHRVALLNKNYEWYSQFNWAEDKGACPEGYDYIWPIQ
jgi:hypothetical protein